MKKEYPYIVKPVEQEEYGVNYVVEYLDFPGITGGGDSQEEAVRIANEALDMYMESLESEGKEIPIPTDFNATGRVTLRLPKSMHIRVIQMAEREGVSLNTYIIDALSQKLHTNALFDEIYNKIANDYLKRIVSTSMIQKRVDSPIALFDYEMGARDKSLLTYSNVLWIDTIAKCKEKEKYVFSS